jgi:GR25 family glycosyltransferase involved in LPS biosynthesis
MIHVLEDDAVISEKVENINKYVKSVPEDWDLIYLGFFSHPFYHRKDIKISESVYKINTHTFRTHSYIINKKGAQKLLANAFPIIHHIDAYISYCAMEGGLNAYRPKRSMINQRVRKSSISGTMFMKPNINALPSSFVTISILISLCLIIFVILKLIKLKLN